MLRIPEDVVASDAHATVEVLEATVIDYRANPALVASQVLVHRPTFVLVRTGIKQLLPQRASAPLVGPPGTLIAMRSGTHVVSELASLCAMSVSTFKRHFKRVFGTPPATWLA